MVAPLRLERGTASAVNPIAVFCNRRLTGGTGGWIGGNCRTASGRVPAGLRPFWSRPIGICSSARR